MKIAFLHQLENKLRKEVKRLFSGGINRVWADDIYQKTEGLFRCKDSIDVLALGSSHGAFGFKAQLNEFNFCTASQDLYYSWKLYESLAVELPQLKTVMLFYSVFSPGFELERTGELGRCEYYFSILGIPYKTKEIQEKKGNKNIRTLWEGYAKKHPLLLSQDYRGNEVLQKTMKISLEERVQAHLKHNRRNNGQSRFLEQMKFRAEQCGHRIVVVIPPFRKDYVEKVGAFDEVFSELKNINNLGFLNFYNDETFTAKDFVDMDHLNPVGAEKLSQKLRRYLTGEINRNG